MLYWGFSPTKERPEAQHMKCAVDLQGGKKTLLVGYGVNMSVNLKERHISSGGQDGSMGLPPSPLATLYKMFGSRDPKLTLLCIEHGWRKPKLSFKG
ncbi:hypothetical protein AOLI_G00197780 [Acnodon oligacanthus]